MAVLLITALIVVAVAIIVSSRSVQSIDRLPRVLMRRITMPIQAVSE